MVFLACLALLICDLAAVTDFLGRLNFRWTQLLLLLVKAAYNSIQEGNPLRSLDSRTELTHTEEEGIVSRPKDFLRSVIGSDLVVDSLWLQGSRLQDMRYRSAVEAVASHDSP